MTLIFAAALRDCALIASDSRRADLGTKTFTEFDKTVQLSPSVIAARFGYGGAGADQMWTDLLALPLQTRSDIHLVMEAAALKSRPVYEERRNYFSKQGQGDYGLTLLFASFEAQRAGVHWIDFKNDEGIPRHAFRSSESLIVATGPSGCDSIVEAQYRSHIDQGGRLAVKAWVFSSVQKVAAIDSSTVAPPAYLQIVGSPRAGPVKVSNAGKDDEVFLAI